jgi:hypothetical protein
VPRFPSQARQRAQGQRQLRSHATALNAATTATDVYYGAYFKVVEFLRLWGHRSTYLGRSDADSIMKHLSANSVISPGNYEPAFLTALSGTKHFLEGADGRGGARPT